MHKMFGHFTTLCTKGLKTGQFDRIRCEIRLWLSITVSQDKYVHRKSSVIRQKGESQNVGNKNFPKNEYFSPPDTHMYVWISGDKKCSFFGKFGVLCFLVTSVLKFTLLLPMRDIHTATYTYSILLVGVVMHDLVALETATSDYVESNSEKLINFHKMVLVSNILEQILRVTQEHPDVHPKKEVFNVIRVRRIVFDFSSN